MKTINNMDYITNILIQTFIYALAIAGLLVLGVVYVFAWIVAAIYDSLWYQESMYGSEPIHIEKPHKPTRKKNPKPITLTFSNVHKSESEA